MLHSSPRAFVFSINDSIQQWLEMVLACFFPALALLPTLLCALEIQACIGLLLDLHPLSQWPVAFQCSHCDIELLAGYVQPCPCVKSVGVWGHTWFGRYHRPPSSQCDRTVTTAEYPLTGFC